MKLRLYREIVTEKPYLFWSVGNKRGLSTESVVEAVLNYGNFNDVLNLFEILSIKRVSEIFYKQSGLNRNNYKKQTQYFFDQYFKKRGF